MKRQLIEKYWDYIVHNNPEVMFNLQESYSTSSYLNEKVESVMPMVHELELQGIQTGIIEEMCLKELTRELRPSKYLYLKGILEEDFERYADGLRESGLMTYELLNIMEACEPIFEEMGFCEENEDDRKIRYAIMGCVDEYLEESKLSMLK
ncbi:hypothetical protein [Chitinophaga japonensis]|uniref:DUF1896 family protein n=1 Tax=Chitinophaga japonensis TaxID=104662 RepID=A0A562T448_CHIJA|nr:hypothetical protein [Chitinophaga japonensis]TWI87836.1 hypothetical protein LX66_1907 [Chitinophaga japonensis]